MPAEPQTYLTREEYLALERVAEVKSEYIDGNMIAMPGSSPEHNLIVTNLIAQLHSQLKGRPDVVYPSDLKVWIPDNGRYTYPDVTVVCGESRFQDDHQDTLINPTLIIEVLSPGTESYDRGRKFDFYRSIESLAEYLLITQYERRVEQFMRGDSGWALVEYLTPEEIVPLPSVDCVLAMAEVYDKVPIQ
ncbi:MAG: Uma2 family endonuclease [bacterium]|nr:Uma2 family endonuclease [bacterium]